LIEKGLDVPLDTQAIDATLGGLHPFPTAITTVADGRANGLIVLSAAPGGILPDRPRVTVNLTKFNLTHDLVHESGVFVVHLLGNDDDVIETSLDIIMRLGGRSGRDGDKLGALRTTTGATGAPILLDAWGYVEARVVKAFDADEHTIFLGDVVAVERLREGRRLSIGEAWSRLPPEWIEHYERNHLAQLEHARRCRALATEQGAER
jgi:flavin reductase (DIM6/NTAB) family NADH-FMN oxidoreductase RutF